MIEVLVPGHLYAIHGIGVTRPQILEFVLNRGDKYPGNAGAPHGGAQTQDLIRIAIDRTQYLNGQGSCFETEMALAALRQALAWYEVRAARCMGEHLEADRAEDVEAMPACKICGHIACCREVHDHLPGSYR